MSAQSIPPDHVRYLDGLRGVAILMVVMIHVAQLIALSGPLRDATAYGVRGVQLFFIVSGLTLTIAHLDRPLRLANFAARRFFRIAPMFYAGAIFYLLVGAVSNLRFAPQDVRLGEVLMTLAFVHDWSVVANNKVVPGGWSIGCEAMFYLAFPLLLVTLRRQRTRFWIALVAIYIAGGASNLVLRRYVPGDTVLVNSFAFSFWLTQLPAFATGCWLALGIGQERVSARTAGWIFVLALILLVIDSQMRGRTNLLISISLLSMLVWAAGRARPPILESRPMSFLGQISFSLYLIHFFIVSLAVDSAARIEGIAGAPLAFIILYLGTLAVCIPLAALTFRWVEQPFINYGRGLFRVSAPNSGLGS